jgi:NAD(P)-dependent dehydrogenase (short-subunit alcohol dehydrogenase family)
MGGVQGGDVAVVTGAASGIGRQLATTLLARDVTVVGVDLDAPALADAVGDGAEVCDLRDSDAFVALLARVEAERGRIDFLANIAGTELPLKAVGASVDPYRDVLAVNFFAPCAGTLQVLPGMVARGRGIVVNCSSDSVRSPIAHDSPYVSSKGALSAFSESVALEVRPQGVSVHVLYPGFVVTAMGQRALDRGMKRPPKGVLRTVEQVADTVVERAGGKSVDINASRTTTLTPLLKTLVPPLYRRVMAGRAIPV